MRSLCHKLMTFTRPMTTYASVNPKIRTSSKLDLRDLKDLFSGNIMALRIPEFCPNEAIEKAVNCLKEKEIIEYNNAKGVGKFKDIGMAYFEAEDETKKKEYYEKKNQSFRAVRNAFSPYLSPIDKVRVELGELWPHDASLLDLGCGPMFVGLVRAIKGEILPHEDKLYRDDPSITKKINYVSQIAFNCYLTMPNQGGELELWDKTLTTEEYNHLRGSSYGIDRSLLPPKILTIKPRPGEFLAFNANLLHAVTPSTTDKVVRISVSGFIVYQGPNSPLRVMS